MESEDLNSVVDAVKLRRNQLHYQDAQSFRIGDRVSFKGRHNVIEKGTEGFVQKVLKNFPKEKLQVLKKNIVLLPFCRYFYLIHPLYSLLLIIVLCLLF